MRKIDFKALDKADIMIDSAGQINLEEFREFKQNKLKSSQVTGKTKELSGLSKRKKTTKS